MKRRQGFLLFVSACIPGCGQMYQGYMQRGLSILALFCVTTMLISALSMGVLGMLLPLIWLFGFFDTYNIKSMTDEQAAAKPDAWLFIDPTQKFTVKHGKNSVIGWVLIVIGIMMLYNVIISCIPGDTMSSWLSSTLRYYIPRTVVTVLMILLGLWFIRGPKAVPEDDDVPTFNPVRGNDQGNGHE